MKKTTQKVISILLVVFTLFSAFPLHGIAQEGQTQVQFNNNAKVAGKNYCATAAAQWAIDHVYDYNSVLFNRGYWDDGGDCANFVSQCLYMGGVDMDEYWNISGYKAHWGTYYGDDYSGSYIRCQQLYNYLVKIGAQVIRNPSASQVSVGDVILYRREGASRMTHTAIVIAIKNGVPVVAAHSTGTTRYRSDEPGYEWHLNFSGNNTYLMKLNGTTCVNYNPRNFDVYVATGGDTRLYKSSSTSSGYYSTFLTGSYPDYAHVYKKSADGQWGYTFRYGKWGWIRLNSFTYLSHQQSAEVSHDFGAWFVVQVADCKNDGIDKHICKRCGYEETKTTKGGHIIDPKATCLSAGFCKVCGEQCENALGHDWNEGTVTTQPTCTENGVKYFVCKRDSSHTKTEPVKALDHNYETSVTSPTCTAHGETVYTCTRCSHSYMVANPNGSWSDWTTDTSLLSTLPSNKIQKKTQYRYRDKKTTTSYNTSMSGWTQNGGEWVKQSTNSFNYASFPSGFDTSHSIYTSFHKSCDVSNSETTTTKRTVSTSWAGYVYWHWMYDTNKANGTSSRSIYNKKGTGPVSGYGYKYFGAFTSTKGDYSSSTTYCESLGIRNYIVPERTSWNDCQGATRWFRFDYYTATYTDYKKLFNYWQWGSWSGWQDSKVTSSDNRQVETRTLYKYDLTTLGHNWTNAEKIQVCDCGTKESKTHCYAIGQICTRCSLTNSDKTEYFSHSYGPWYEISRENGVVTYRRDCANCDCYEIKTDNECNYVLTSSVAPTCTNDGYEIWTCSYHNETQKITTATALGHTLETENVVIKAAECDEDGILRTYCERYDDGKTCNHYVDTVIPAFGHALTKSPAVPATCTENGQSEYYQCDLCKKFFADVQGKTEIEQDSWIITAKGHVSVDSVEWEIVTENGCGKTGWKHKLCNRVNNGEICNHILVEEAIPEIPAKYHVVMDMTENAELVAGDEYSGEWAPTACDAFGVIYWTCENCENTPDAHSSQPDVIYESEIIGKLPHIETERVIKEAYCIYTGEYEVYCERCENILEPGLEIPAPCSEHKLVEIKDKGCIYKKCTNAPCVYVEGGDHNFQRDAARDVFPTCTETGIEANTCSICGEHKDTVLEALGHNYAVASTVDAKCTDPGYTLNECQRNGCDSAYESDYIPPIGHNLKKTDSVASLCEKEGNIEYYTCQRDYCKKIFTNSEAAVEITIEKTITSALGHEADNNWIVVKEPTCTDNGEEQCKCIRHDDGATCDKIFSREIEINPDAHKWDNGVIDPESTCKNHGTKTYTCQYDNAHTKKESVDINPDNHVGETYVKDAKEPTCTVDGYTGDTYCSDCNEKLRDGEVIPYHGHDWDEWTVETEPTCEGKGLEKRVCKNDENHIEENELEPIGHKWDNGVIDPESTCKNHGTKTYTCQYDNTHTKKESIDINPDNHVGETYIKDKSEPDCTKDGYTGDTYCSDCNALLEEGAVVPKLGHYDSGEWTVTDKADCTNDGSKELRCKRCNFVLDTEVIPARNHNWSDWKIVSNPTIDKDGLKERHCKNTKSNDEYNACNAKEQEPINKINSYTARFVVADNNGDFEYNGKKYRIIKDVRFAEGTKAIVNPDVPEIPGYIGSWEPYELNDKDIVIEALYELKSSDNQSELKSDKTYVYKDGVATIKLSAFAETLNAKVPMGATPYDIVLVLDQSSSMVNNKIGSKTRLEVLKEVSTDFINTVYNSANEYNVEHRIAIVGYSGTENKYENTGLITPTGKVKTFGNLKTADYESAFVDVRSNQTLLLKSIADMYTHTGTSADIGMEIARKVLANNNNGRQKIVLFITDGEPADVQGRNYWAFSKTIANTTIEHANAIKNLYGAQIYSIGVATKTNPNDETSDMNKFLHYVSSNYPNAKSMTDKGSAAPYKNYFVSAEDSKELEQIFDDIFAQQIVNTISFTKVSFCDTVSKYFTLTLENEIALRESVKAEYGVSDDDIIISRNNDGTTNIRINNLIPKPVFDDENIQIGYGVVVEFDVTANDKTLDGGVFETNTEDAGIESDGVKVIDFKVPEGEKISSGRAIIEFRIGDEVYAIREVNVGDLIEAPETEMAEWVITDGTTVTKDYTVITAQPTSETYTVTWNTGNNTIVETYYVGQVINIPSVNVPDGQLFIGWDVSVPYRMPSYDLTFTALYKSHTHKYTVEKSNGDCITGIDVTYLCECGASYTETAKYDAHKFTALVQMVNNDSVATIICTVCGKSEEKVINYQAVYSENTGFGNWHGKENTRIVDLTLYNNEGITIQPDGYIYVKLNAENDKIYNNAKNGKLVIKRVNNDNSTDEIKAISNGNVNGVGYYVEGDYIVLKLDHFSYYVLSVPEEADDMMSYGEIECAFKGHNYIDGNCEYCGEKDPSVPEEPEYNYAFSIQNPSRTEIRNKDGIILHANIEGNAPAGSYIRWESSNGNFDKNVNGSNLKIIAKNKGYTTFTAVLCDADGNELARDSVEMYSKSGFFDKIGGFFRGLFGLTKIYEN